MNDQDQRPDGGSEWQGPMWQTVTSQFQAVANEMQLSDELRERLLQPRRSLVVNFPVRMDDGRLHAFTGYRVQHSLAIGPTKGGIRYAADVSLGECAALAVWMSMKSALLKLPYGGAKGGVRCDPRQMSVAERERLTRRFTAELMPIIGPDRDIPAPDMGTGEQEMAWMYDTYSTHMGYAVPAVVTGKPRALGGTTGRARATGEGVVYVTEQIADSWGWYLDRSRAAVQGAGNVGVVVAEELARRGTTLVAFSDRTGAWLDPHGLPTADLVAHIRAGQELDTWEQHGGAPSPTLAWGSNEDLLACDCEILLPCALEAQLTAENADRVQCLAVVEGANGPTTPEAEQMLLARGVRLVPDILANAGGVTASYFEWAQSQQHWSWTDEQVSEHLRRYMRSATARVLDVSGADERGMRLASGKLALEQMAEAAELRAVYP